MCYPENYTLIRQIFVPFCTNTDLYKSKHNNMHCYFTQLEIAEEKKNNKFTTDFVFILIKMMQSF